MDGGGVTLVLLLVVGIGLAMFFRSYSREAERARTTNYKHSIITEVRSFADEDGNLELPVLTPEAHGYRPVGRERLVAIQPNVARMELKGTGRYSTSGASFSIPIVKGVRYRVGGGSIRAEKTWQATARGRLIVTDKALCFESDAKNERITWTQIAGVELMVDGLKVMKRSGPPRVYVVDSPDPRFSAALMTVLHT